MYERKGQKPATRQLFARRVAQHVLAAMLMVLISVAIGMVGYVELEQLSWLDAFLESAMLLGGMGPVHAPVTPGGKLFAGLYALYAGLVFLLNAALVLTPVAHRVLHKFHWDSRV